MTAPGHRLSESQIALRHIRGWGRVVSALAVRLAKSPQNKALAETMLKSCEKLWATWHRARSLNEARNR